jgi:hypothetical protein
MKSARQSGVKWLATAVIGIGALAVAGVAVALTLGRDPARLVLFDVRLTKAAEIHLRDNGLNYAFWMHAVGFRDNVLYVDQLESVMVRPPEYADRVFRYRILEDWKGASYFNSESEFGFKDDDHLVYDLDFAHRSIRGYLDAAKEGRQLPKPRDFDAYRADGLKMGRYADGGCDPLRTYNTIASAEIGDDLSRRNEAQVNRSLVLVGEYPMMSSGSDFARKNCRQYTDWLGSHSTRANAYGFSVYRLSQDYALIPRGFPLAVIVTDPREEFCTAISYRDAYGTRRVFYAIYTSPDRLAEMLGERNFTDTKNRDAPLAEAAYRQQSETRYRALMRAVTTLDCISIHK